MRGVRRLAAIGVVLLAAGCGRGSFTGVPGDPGSTPTPGVSPTPPGTSAVAVDWVITHGGAADDRGLSIAVDPSDNDNVIVAGSYIGPADLGGPSLPQIANEEAFIAKYGATDGAHVWSFGFPGNGNDRALSVCVDPAGRVYIGGRHAQDIDLDGAGTTHTSNGGDDVFIAGYTITGPSGLTRDWSDSDGFGLGIDDQLTSVARSGGTLAASGSLNYNDTGVLVVGRYDATTGAGRVENFAGQDFVSDDAYDVAFAADGDILTVGSFEGNLDFGLGQKTATAGTEDIFVAKLDATDVSEKFSFQFGGNGNEAALGIAVDDNDDFYITGYFDGTLNFGGADLVATDIDGFVAKFDSLGAHLWSMNFGGPGNQFPAAIAVNPDGVVVVGEFYDTFEVKGTPPVANPAPDGAEDPFVLQLETQVGSPIWSAAYVGPNSDGFVDVAVADGAIFVVGYLRETLDIDGTTYDIGTDTRDVLVIRFGITAPQ